MINSKDTFTIIDYIVFLSLIAISALIGIYFICKDRKKHQIENYFLANRKLKIFPVAMSQLASFTSAVSVLGFSHETYRYGSMYLIISLSYIITQPFAAHIFVPFFHRLKITSAYEYLELRFNSRLVRVCAALIFCLQMLLYMSVVLYTPSLAINQVMGLSLWISIFLTGIVCTFYTSLGGIKAVVWTDTFQVAIMFVGIISIIVEGIRRIGGFEPLFERLDKGGRIEFFDFDPNPFKRHTFWSIVIGGFFTSLTVYGSNQASIQRYLILPTEKHAIISMYLNLIGTLAILAIAGLCGLVAYGFYYNCDPKSLGRISRYDQILPLLAIDLLKNFPGLNGLFIACIYAASLSTVSSCLNALATVCLYDFFKPLYMHIKHVNELGDKFATNISKLIAAVFGVLVIGLSFLCQYLGSTVVQAALSIFGTVGGPLLGVITFGMFIPYANKYGALCGLITSIIISLTLSISSMIYAKPSASKFFNINGCLNSTTYATNLTELFIINNNNTAVNSINNNSTFTYTKTNKFSFIFQLSYLWYSALAVLNVHLIGSIISILTNVYMKKKFIDTKSLNPKYIINVFRLKLNENIENKTMSYEKVEMEDYKE